jgi:hypothetical protein
MRKRSGCGRERKSEEGVVVERVKRKGGVLVED